MNLAGSQLEAQYRWATAEWPFIHEVEAAHDLPPFLLFAVGSRETNLDEYYVTHPGDGGHGRGLWQLDDRSWEIPEPFPVELQAQRAAEFLRSLIDQEGGELVPALNRYNSGSPRTERTTGHDYGPDVVERMEYLVGRFPGHIAPTTQRPQEVNMLLVGVPDKGIMLLLGGGKGVHMDSMAEVEKLAKAGVPWVQEDLPSLAAKGFEWLD